MMQIGQKYKFKKNNILKNVFGPFVLSFLLVSASCHANIVILFDDEAESVIETIINPLTKEANINPSPNIIMIQTKEMNAATNGHDLFVCSGLISNIGQHPGSIIGVMAHEISHIALGHHSRRFDERLLTSSEMLISGASLLAALKSGDFNLYHVGRHIAKLHSMAGVGTYSRAVEDATDRLSVHLLAASGYDPNYATRFEHFSQINYSVNVRSLDYIEFLMTHPTFNYRLSAVKRANARLQEELAEIKKIKPVSAPPIFDQEWLDRYFAVFFRLKRLHDSRKNNKSTINTDVISEQLLPYNQETYHKPSEEFATYIKRIYDAMDNLDIKNAIEIATSMSNSNVVHYRTVGNFILADLNKKIGQDFEENLEYYIANCNCAAKASRIMLAEALLQDHNVKKAEPIINVLVSENLGEHYTQSLLRLQAQYNRAIGNSVREKILLAKEALEAQNYNKFKKYISQLQSAKNIFPEDEMAIADLILEYKALGIKRFVTTKNKAIKQFRAKNKF